MQYQQQQQQQQRARVYSNHRHCGLYRQKLQYCIYFVICFLFPLETSSKGAERCESHEQREGEREYRTTSFLILDFSLTIFVPLQRTTLQEACTPNKRRRSERHWVFRAHDSYNARRPGQPRNLTDKCCPRLRPETRAARERASSSHSATPPPCPPATVPGAPLPPPLLLGLISQLPSPTHLFPLLMIAYFFLTLLCIHAARCRSPKIRRERHLLSPPPPPPQSPLLIASCRLLRRRKRRRRRQVST